MKCSYLTAIQIIIVTVSLLYPQKNHYEIREYNSKEGLSQSVVNSVLQDSRGFVWAGTQDGLNKFDGNKFKVFRYDPDDSNSISNNNIWKIYEDSKNNLWICTYGGGLNLYDYKKDVFIRFRHSDNNSNSINGDDVRSIYEDDSGIFWIGTNKGLNKFDYGRNKWIDLSKDSKNALLYKNVRDIYPFSKDELWLACYGVGLVFYNKISGKSILYSNLKSDKYSLSNNHVWKIIKDSKGIYWVLTFGGGINLFNSADYKAMGNISFSKFYDSQIDKDLTAIIESSNGEILIGTDTQGFVIVDSSRTKLTHIKMDLNYSKGLTNNGVWDICKNNSGGYWLGTFGGGLNFLQLENLRFTNITTDSKPSAINNPIVFAIKKIAEDEYFIGTYGGGLNRINTSTGRSLYYTEKNSTIASNYITAISKENASSYWIGTDGNGITHYNKANNIFTNFNSSNSNKLAGDFVKSLLIDSYNNIWVGTLKGLRNIQKAENVKNEFYSDPAFDKNTRSLMELEPGKILIGTHGDGVFIHNLKDKTFEKLGNEMIDNQQISEMFLDRNKILWIGTRGNGLIKYNFLTGTAELFTVKNGLSNNTVLGIEQDNYGKLWIITNKGISTFNTRDSVFVNYYAVDGLLSNEFVQGAIYKDNEGIIYAGSIKGVEIIDPSKFNPNKFNPLFEITKLTVLNEERSLRDLYDSELKLSHYENFIKIDFASLDFTNPTKNLYRYKLTPGNNDWVQLGTESAINFANLTPGKYLLELNGSNSDGVWSTNIRILRISISPPFYNTYWFYTLTLLTIGFILYKFHYVKTQKRLEMEQLRLKISSDLHDDLGTSLSQIAINADSINYENDIVKIKKKGELIRTKSAEMINIMNDVIWSIDSRNDKLESLVDRIRITAIQQTESKDIKTEIKINIQNPDKMLTVAFRQNVFLIVKEAVNNAVKYSDGTIIRISINEKDEHLKISIADSGDGLPDSIKGSGNGIKNIKHRANSINGRVQFIKQNGLTINFEAKII